MKDYGLSNKNVVIINTKGDAESVVSFSSVNDYLAYLDYLNYRSEESSDLRQTIKERLQ